MSKQMYMTTQVAASTITGNPDAKLDGTTPAGWYYYGLSEVRGNAMSTYNINTVAGPTNGLETIVGALPTEWISEPLSAAFTIAGTITLNLWGLENNMSANAALNVAIDKISGVDNSITRIATSANATEMGTTAAAANFTVTPTSTAVARGDRIRV